MVNAGISKVGVITKSNYQSLMDHIGSGKSWDPVSYTHLHRKDKPDSEAVQALVARWQETITRRYYPCTKEILSGFCLLYTSRCV